MAESKLRVLVVDDSMIFRKVVRDALADVPGIEVVGVAADGKSALSRLETLTPDLLTLDIEMPHLNGLQVLEELQRTKAKCGAIMLSALTSAGAKLTTQALSLGAFDFVLKPTGESQPDCLIQLKRNCCPRSTHSASQNKAAHRHPSRLNRLQPFRTPRARLANRESWSSGSRPVVLFRWAKSCHSSRRTSPCRS